jgi:small neutral amino acid transporter SnatA (MarC family)
LLIFYSSVIIHLPANSGNLFLSFNTSGLRQVRQSYNVALTVIGTSAILAFLGVGLLYCNKVSEGGFATAAGGLTTVAATGFANQKKKELQQMMELVEKGRAKEELRKMIPRPQAVPPVKLR